MDLIRFKEDLKEQLSKDEISDVLNRIKSAVSIEGAKLRDDIYLLEARLNSLKRKNLIGANSSNEIAIDNSNIRESVLELINRISRNDLQDGIFSISTEKSNPQWCFVKKLDTKGNSISFIDLVFTTKSKYIRIGFKFLNVGKDIFGNTRKIICDNEHVVVHIGKSEERNQFSVSSIINGNFIQKRVEIGDVKISDNKLRLSVFFSIDNKLEFYFNESLISWFEISSDLRKNAYLLAWGDNKFEYDYSVQSLNYASMEKADEKKVNQILKDQSGVKVLSLQNGQKVNRQEVIEGVYKLIPSGYTLRLLVFHSSQKFYWPMNDTIKLDSFNERWSGDTTFGSANSIRSKFYLKVALVDNKTNNWYNNYLENCLEIGKWDPIRNSVPLSVIICDELEVKR